MSNNAYGKALSRRRLLQLAGAAGAGSLVTACAGPGGGGGGGAAKSLSAPKTSGPVEGELSFAHWRGEDQEVFAKLIEKFQQEHPKVTVRQDISPSDDYQASALQQIQSGNVGDVFTAFRGSQFFDMAKAGVFTNLTELPLVGNYRSQFIKPGQFQGSQLGMPYQLVFNMPVYNVDLFDKHGISEPPRSWDGFLSMCDKLKGAGVIPMAWPGGNLGNTTHLLNSMVMNNAPSPDMFAKIESGEYKATDEWFVKTLEQYAQLRPYFQPNATGTQVEPAEQMFASKKAAMLATGSFHMVAVRALGADFAMDLLSPITVPAEKAKFFGVHNATFILGVNSASDNQAAATAFVDFLSQPANAGRYANNTVQHVTVADVEYTNRDLKAISGWLDRKTILCPIYQFTNLDISDAVTNAAVKVVGGTKPKQAAQRAQKIIDQQLQ